MNETIWEPRPFDIEWTKQLIANLRTDPGLWGIPMTGAIYLISASQKSFTLIEGPEDNLYNKIARIGAVIGFSVKHEPRLVTEEMCADAFGLGKTKMRI